MCIFALMKPKSASKLGGKLGRLIGPLTKLHGIAKKNIKETLKINNKKEERKILSAMWSNLGNNLGEFIHLHKFNPYTSKETIVIGKEILDKSIKKAKANNKGLLLVSGHIGNWELGALSLKHSGLEPVCVYRAANNPYIEKIIQYGRRDMADFVPKGDKGAKKIFSYLRKGRPVAMLVVQKLNEGPLITFLGKKARTAPAVAELALRLNIEVIPVRFKRNSNMSFSISFEKSIKIPSNRYTHPVRVKMLLRSINIVLEKWIKENPEQWLWVHKRWP